MNKPIFLLIAALPALAAADVQLYGTLKSGIEVSQTKRPGQERQSLSRISDHGSHIGMRGSHRIGGASSKWDGSAETERPAPTLGERLKQRKEEGLFRYSD